jgi:hypothetical protein
MADHVWFVPAAGGGFTLQRSFSAVPLINLQTADIGPNINVQWGFVEFPVVPPPGTDTLLPCCFKADAVNGFGLLPVDGMGVPVTGPDYLAECYARFKWRSTTDCPDNTRVVEGGSLRIGTVFSRYLEEYPNPPVAPDGQPDPDSVVPGPYNSFWNTVEAWCKFLVVDKTKLSKATFGITAAAPLGTVGQIGSAPNDWLVHAVNGQWRVAYAKYGLVASDWDGFSDRNLRAVLTVDGTTTPANVGDTEIWVEWFAFRLSNQGTPA